MNKVVCLLLFLAVFSMVKPQEYDEMTHEEIISESQLCGESHFYEEECLEKPNCVFMHWFKKVIGGTLRLCMSYNEIMKYFIKNPVEYLKKQGTVNHRAITKSNFCDVLDDSKMFYDEHGDIKKCTVSKV